jgi:hypothetical protein
MLGPFTDPLFRDLHCSPLMTAHKDDNKCRIIVDLSFPSPAGDAINFGYMLSILWEIVQKFMSTPLCRWVSTRYPKPVYMYIR